MTELPSLVYFRNGIPVVYHGDLRDEEEVLEWLIQHQVGNEGSACNLDRVDESILTFSDKRVLSI